VGCHDGWPLEVFDALFAERCVNHNIPVTGIPGTKAGFRQLVEL